MSFTPLAAVGTLVFTLVNVLTYIRSKNWNGVWTQVIAWVAGIAGILIAAHTQFAAQITFGSRTLSEMDWQTQVFLGLIATSILSTVNEVKKAIDTTDSAQKAPLFAGLTPATMRQGQATLGVNGAVTIADPKATPDSLIQVTALEGQQGNIRVTDRQAGQVTIGSTEATDRGQVAYEIRNK